MSSLCVYFTTDTNGNQGGGIVADFKELKKLDCREVARREGLEPNQQGKIRCFLHTGDSTPSLQLYENGWHCFGCGEHGDAVDLVARYRNIPISEAAERLRDSFGIHSTPAARKGNLRFEAEFFYRSCEGPDLKKVIRRATDTGKKDVKWWHKDTRVWKIGGKKLTPCLYDNGVESSGIIYVAEGEKCAARLGDLGVHAVTLPNGAQSTWADFYTPAFVDKAVIIVLDNDAPGRKYGTTVATNTYPVAKSVRVLDLSQIWPEIPEHGDIADMIAVLGRQEAAKRLTELAKRTPEWAPAPEKGIFDEFGFYSVPDLTEAERRPPEFIVDGMIPCGMTFISGAPKIRKTFLALQMAISVATGSPFLGHDTIRCDVAYLDLEGSKSRVSFRTDRMSTPIPRNVFITNNVEERLADGLVDKLRQLHQERPSIRLIIIDTYSRARGCFKSFGVNAYDADVALLEPIQRMALEENIAVVFIHHDKKGAGFASDSFERLSGTMGISGSADCVINLIADGKRFDGKATLEYTPRDAKGGEKKLVFDERFGEWQELIESKPDLRGNPICDWIISHSPDKGKAGEFYSYDDLFRFAYNHQIEGAGDKVRDQLEPRRDDLYTDYGIGIQMGVRSNCKRGVRIINLL